MRWRSFAAREDLVRSEPPPLPPEGEAEGRGSSSPEILLAFDPWGAPVVLFALVGEGKGDTRTEVRFAVPRDAGAAFREALRLLVDLLHRRGEERELWTRLPEGIPAAAAVLEACGWRSGPEGIWSRSSAATPQPSEPSRAR